MINLEEPSQNNNNLSKRSSKPQSNMEILGNELEEFLDQEKEMKSKANPTKSKLVKSSVYKNINKKGSIFGQAGNYETQKQPINTRQKGLPKENAKRSCSYGSSHTLQTNFKRPTPVTSQYTNTNNNLLPKDSKYKFDNFFNSKENSKLNCKKNIEANIKKLFGGENTAISEISGGQTSVTNAKKSKPNSSLGLFSFIGNSESQIKDNEILNEQAIDEGDALNQNSEKLASGFDLSRGSSKHQIFPYMENKSLAENKYIKELEMLESIESQSSPNTLRLSNNDNINVNSVNNAKTTIKKVSNHYQQQIGNHQQNNSQKDMNISLDRARYKDTSKTRKATQFQEKTKFHKATSSKLAETIHNKLRSICMKEIEKINFEFMVIEELLRNTKAKLILNLNHDFKKNLETHINEYNNDYQYKCLGYELDNHMITKIKTSAENLFTNTYIEFSGLEELANLSSELMLTQPIVSNSHMPKNENVVCISTQIFRNSPKTTQSNQYQQVQSGKGYRNNISRSRSKSKRSTNQILFENLNNLKISFKNQKASGGIGINMDSNDQKNSQNIEEIIKMGIPLITHTRKISDSEGKGVSTSPKSRKQRNTLKSHQHRMTSQETNRSTTKSSERQYRMRYDKIENNTKDSTVISAQTPLLNQGGNSVLNHGGTSDLYLYVESKVRESSSYTPLFD